MVNGPEPRDGVEHSSHQQAGGSGGPVGRAEVTPQKTLCVIFFMQLSERAELPITSVISALRIGHPFQRGRSMTLPSFTCFCGGWLHSQGLCRGSAQRH